MIRLALSGLAERRLRSVLTAVSILLGVAMVAGTYVLTDQLRGTFTDITETAFEGVDVSIQPRTSFDSAFGGTAVLQDDVVARAARVPGVARAQGSLTERGNVVVHGKVIEPQYAPALLLSASGPPFGAVHAVRGRLPRASGEVAVNRAVADDEGLAVGDAVGVTTRTGRRTARLVGVVDYGEVSSLGGATLVVATLADVQRWSRRAGQVTEVSVAVAPGVSPDEVARRIQRVMPRDAEVRTGLRAASEEGRKAADSITGFLTPAMLAFAAVALVVGGFVIFNTFRITVAQRTREFGLLRAVGATRRQLLGAVVVEALVLGAAASVAGIGLGVGLAELAGRLFESAWGMPHGALELRPRTVVAALGVGLGVTLLSAIAPALRATRVPPMAALRQDAVPVHARHPRLRAAVTAAVALGGLALVAQGLTSDAAATDRLASMGMGSMLLFAAAALAARHVVGPLVQLVGRPLRRMGGGTGELAAENAAADPSRTAVTAATLLVGLALVVFVAVLAQGLRGSVSSGVEDRLTGAALLVSSSSSTTPLPDGAAAAAQVAEPGRVIPMHVDQVEVDGAPVNLVTDVVSGVDGRRFAEVYRAQWLEGSDATLRDLGPGEALVEEQFAKQHHLRVGQRFTIETSSGRRSTVRAVGRYRDPAVLQGMVVDEATFARASVAADPWLLYVLLRPGEDPDVVDARVTEALSAFPTAEVRTMDEYLDFALGEVDQMVVLLYALLAMSLLIAVFGIANSLFLAIHERTHELGLLRAVGATTGQVRALVRFESVVIAAIGGVLGTAVGVALAWLTTMALHDWGLGFHLPVGQLALCLALGLGVGIVGSVAPARRAARVDLLRALTAE
ncbi:ABC transporter permease [Conexibacter sp. SYSU D00693]|uniref:ABC transporter permease n=1 Tax=Conexibacter sp. SYSU D00693 TaxID=2812560 RepID=UPI00196A1FAD|nr:FtsX-like permease family protein [Conexibacter sp. SYSU D00693]